MRHQDQINDEHPDVVTSDPVPVPPPHADPDTDRDEGHSVTSGHPDDRTDDNPTDDDPIDDDRADDDGARADRDGLDDGGSFDDPIVRHEVVGGRPEAESRTAGDDLVDGFTGDGPDARTGEPALGDRLSEARDSDLVDDDPVPGDRMDDHDDDLDRTEFHEPAPQPTTFGAATVGGAAAAAAMAGEQRVTEHDVDELDADRSRDGAVEDRDSAIEDRDRVVEDRDGGVEDRDGGVEDRDGVIDDRAGGNPGTASYDRTVVDDDRAEDDRADDDGADSGRADWTGTVDDDDQSEAARTGTSGAAVAAVPVGTVVAAEPAGTAVAAEPTGTGVAAEPTDSAVSAGSAGSADGSAVPDDRPGIAPGGGMLPGAVPAQPVTALFTPDSVQGFRDRWRDVQLRFVDDPHAAVDEARGLVEESIETLAAALSAQKNELGSWRDDQSVDTEQLRMVVRRYRDFLDRVLGL